MRARHALTFLLLVVISATAARADGGALLLHQDAGPFTITLFATPRPLVVGMADLSVMVQDRSNGQVLLDPQVDINAEHEGTIPQAIHLTQSAAANRLLQAATLPLPEAGNWRLIAVVRRGSEVVRVSTEVRVEPDKSRNALVWFYVLLPVAVIAVFLLHQALKRF